MKRPLQELVVSSFAKINLGLEVLGLRQDGYHELRTIFQTLDLKDDVRIALGGRGIRVTCSDPTVPVDETNLAFRAAAQLLRRSGRRTGVRIDITKRIPAGGGLGGGSSNAAAVLIGLDRLLHLGLGRAGLLLLARRLGADVPFFLFGGTALGLARGDEVFPLLEQVRCHVVLAFPGRPLLTARVFERLDGELTPRENSLTISRFVSSDLEGAERFGVLRNDLERAALVEAPDLAESAKHMKDTLVAEGALLARMTGSGSTFFGLFAGVSQAKRAKKALEASGIEARVARTLTAAEFRTKSGL